ncbi:MAG: AraC family transcriptional regulator, partial [Gammaproteobacteria bacterium]|nr:AraC family transcriptional regulator [Gammaproteobacteria bacterium]
RSTNVLAVPDKNVANAIRYLWDNYMLPLRVEDVVRDLDVCRSTVEKAFRKHLGRGINAELQRKRLEALCELLVRT